MRVISYCLWGDNPIYNIGLIENIKLAKMYYKGWENWVFLHSGTVPEKTLDELKKHDGVRIFVKDDPKIRRQRFMLWRFEPADDNTVECFIARDTDSRISPREVLAVREWLEFGKTLHIMRDHPCHYPKILGGMFGMKCIGIPDVKKHPTWREEIDAFYAEHGDDTNDQSVVEEYFYDRLKDDRIIHDEIKKYEGEECRPFEVLFEKKGYFVGCYIYPDGSTDPQTSGILTNWLVHNLPHRISPYQLTYHESLMKVGSILKNVYVMHYSKLVERRESLKKQINKTLLDCVSTINWVDNFDREILTQEMINKNYRFRPEVLPRSMTLPEIANGMAHTHILETVYKNDEIGLVLEDDTVFKKDFIHHLQHVLENLPENWDMICLGGPVVQVVCPAKTLPRSLESEFTNDRIILHKPTSPGPCTASCFLINKKGAERILTSGFVNPISSPIDDTIWVIGKAIGLEMYWCQPWLSYEASKSGVFATTLERGF